MRRHALARQRTPPDTAPRNEALGAQWRAGYAKLEEVGFSFDMQLNPHQFTKAAALAKAHPGVPVILNHMGTPTADDLGAKADAYWEGMAALAALPHVAIKISMLVYVDKEWDKAAPVVEAVRRVIALFGDERVCFAVRRCASPRTHEPSRVRSPLRGAPRRAPLAAAVQLPGGHQGRVASVAAVPGLRRPRGAAGAERRAAAQDVRRQRSAALPSLVSSCEPRGCDVSDVGKEVLSRSC